MDPFDFGASFGAFNGAPQWNFNFRNMPEMFAGMFSRAGISPAQFMSDPNSAMAAVQPQPEAPSLGESLAPSVPLPRADPRDAQASLRNPQPQGSGDSLANALKGVKAPEPPQAQRVSTPGAPRPSASIKSGELIALLQALGAPGNQVGLNLPPTLGTALSKFRGF